MRIKDIATSVRDGFNMDPRLIDVLDGFNARDFSVPENAEHVATLKRSIRKVGIKTPLTIQLVGERVFLVDGESRLRATLELIAEGIDIATVPCQAEGRWDDDATRVAGMVVRNSGKQLTMLEQGDVYRRLVNYGWDEDKIADNCGYSLLHIKNCLLLVSSAQPIQDAVRTGSVSGSAAVINLRKHKEDAPRVIVGAVSAARSEGRRKANPQDVAKAVSNLHGFTHDPVRDLTLAHVSSMVDLLRMIARGEISDPQLAAADRLRNLHLDF